MILKPFIPYVCLFVIPDKSLANLDPTFEVNREEPLIKRKKIIIISYGKVHKYFCFVDINSFVFMPLQHMNIFYT
jgi:hypothetical protein